MTPPENFLPWEQIEPLIQPGMTGNDLADALRARLGLSRGYGFLLVRGTCHLTFREAVRFGITIVRYDDLLPFRDRSIEPLTSPSNGVAGPGSGGTSGSGA